ncbi:ribosomal-protein-alanine N-acetyltransferase [Flavobacterium sp. 103]|uniref:GNAT family N-acetyltransferase n=1 Tax=Flavobacterium sp. 103 TaxID=2135624 RepID=UPI000D5F8F5C|nr:GNAT family N-acetyltransferase [Flavobacterium sp. 103]PVX47337.1 ribosomal-protein-alanine N-acetyltransferase [Flavobacterium sp. 103]
MLDINFSPFPNLETKRLSLRQVKANDADAILSLRSNDEVMKYIPRPYLKTKEDALQLIAMFDDKIESGIGINWGIYFLEEPEKLLGIIGYYRMKPEHYRAEVGYMLFPEYNGKGIVSEALQRVVEYGFKDMKLHSIEAVLDPENKGSEKVLIKNGFVKEAHLIENEYYEGRFLDSMIYSLLNK